MSIFDDLQEITTLGCAHGCEAEVIEDEDFGLARSGFPGPGQADI